ncbi:MAG: PEP-CTERM sorting domain-containing protein [Planctomycetota bacterium]
MALPAIAFAGEEGDIGLRLNSAGQIETTLTAEGSGDFTGPTERVFVSELETEGLGEFDPVFSPLPPGVSVPTGNTPGFDSPDNTFAIGSEVGLDIFTPSVLSDNFVGYDPIADAFTTVPDGTGVQFFFSSPSALARTTEPVASTDLLLPVFDGSSPSDETGPGRWHRHYVISIFGGIDDTSGDLLAPAGGVYVLEFDVITTDPSVLDSEPTFVVFGVGEEGIDFEDADLDAAVALVEATIPEPASLGLLGLAGLGLMRRRK